MQDISSIENKNQVAIIAVGYNRLLSIKRLLESLDRAHYSCEVPLVVSIDNSGCQELYDYVNTFEWKHGTKYVIIQKERLGLKNHILACGDLTRYFKAVIILEDDIFVSEFFYDYVLDAIKKYGDDPRIGGISLYRPSMDGNLPIDYIQDGNGSFAYQNVESWGQCWTQQMWNAFRNWYDSNSETDFSNIDMPVYMKNWKKAWSKFYMAFQIQENRYFIYPSVSYTTCFSEAGEHGITSSIGQSVLASGYNGAILKGFDDLSKYDIYGANEAIYLWLGLSKDELCIDLRGNNDNSKQKRYVLSPYHYSNKVEKEFALSLRPIELNVKYNVEGRGLYLYNAIDGAKAVRKGFPMALAYYYIRQFNVKVLAKYVFSYTKMRVVQKLEKIIKH